MGSDRVRYRTPPSVPLALNEAFQHALDTGDESDLRQLTCDFVRALRRLQLSPEETLIAVKEALPDPRARAPGESFEQERMLFNSIVSYSIDEYYREPGWTDRQ
jgi:hypothetical protein